MVRAKYMPNSCMCWLQTSFSTRFGLHLSKASTMVDPSTERSVAKVFYGQTLSGRCWCSRRLEPPCLSHCLRFIRKAVRFKTLISFCNHTNSVSLTAEEGAPGILPLGAKCQRIAQSNSDTSQSHFLLYGGCSPVDEALRSNTLP